MRVRSLRMLVLLAVAALVAAGVPPLRSAPSPLDSMVAAERAFSALSVEKGMKEAFVAYLADDGVVFRPTATNGKEVWRERASPKGTLVWEPDYAEMSSAGDLGFTAGPWEYRPPADPPGAEVAYGHFVSMWRRQPDGSYLNVADIGISHGKPGRDSLGSVRLRTGPVHRPQSGTPRRISVPMMQGLDREFARRTRMVTIEEALQSSAATDLRLYRDGSEPRIGRMEAITALDTLAGHIEIFPSGGGVSSSGELGYSFGTYRRYVLGSKAPSDTCTYLNVWRHDELRWELALCVINPIH